MKHFHHLFPDLSISWFSYKNLYLPSPLFNSTLVTIYVGTYPSHFFFHFIYFLTKNHPISWLCNSILLFSAQLFSKGHFFPAAFHTVNLNHNYPPGNQRCRITDCRYRHVGGEPPTESDTGCVFPLFTQIKRKRVNIHHP